MLGTSLFRIFQVYNALLVVVKLEFLGFIVIMAGMSSVAIGKNQIKVEDDMVIIPLREYHKLLEKTAPVYYLKGKQALRLDRLVENGLKEHREGKTIKASSLKDALKIYARRSNRR